MPTPAGITRRDEQRGVDSKLAPAPGLSANFYYSLERPEEQCSLALGSGVSSLP